MRRFSVPFALALCLASAVAFADNDRVTAQFEALTASGISGEARLNPMVQQNTTRIQVQLQGLQPNTEYVAFIYTDGTCTSGTSTQLATFTANPAGRAVFHNDVTQELSAIGSISVQLASSVALLACADVNP